jgi:2',3'-cyclic-nucleotide 2'-phosphodiesterase (5'-nucleotidase family)
MTSTPPAAPRGPTLRLVCINDVYTLENLPRLRSLVRHYATTSPADVFLVTLAGDFVAPSMLSSLDKGRAMVECLNEIGVTHVIFGNHEDDIELAELQARVREFRGVWLNSNVPGFMPALPVRQLIEVPAPGGRSVRVGLLGVVMHDLSVYRRAPFGGSPVLPANAIALELAARLVRDEGCACVLPLTHQSIADDRELARAPQSPRFPVIMGGHEHEVFLEEVAGTWIAKAGSDATRAILIELTWPAEAPAAGSPDLPSVQLGVVNPADFPEDAPLRALVNARMAAVHELESAALMKIPPGEPLSSVGTRSHQTSLGTLLCSRIRDAVGSEGCIINGGGIRAGREYHRHFTYGDLKAELPFDNEITVVSLPGYVLREAIASSRAHAPAESGGFLQVDSRMLVEQPGDVLRQIDGQELAPQRMYRIALMRNLLTGMDHIEPLVRYAREHPECVPPPDCGREIKLVLIDSFSVELWNQLGSFEQIDTNHDGVVSSGELADAVTRVTEEPASPITVGFVMDRLDTNHDHVISREESDSVKKP